MNDAAKALFHHRTHNQSAQAEDRRKIGLNHGVPVGIFHAHGQVVAGDPGVMHQNFKGAIVEQGANERFNRLGVVNIGHHPFASQLAGGKVRLDRPGPCFAGCSPNHMSATPGKVKGDGLPDATRCPRDQRSTSLKRTHTPTSASTVCSEAAS